MRMARAWSAVACAAALLAVMPLRAADAVRGGGYVVYYSAVAAADIPASVAASHQLPRTANAVVVDISVMKGLDAARGTPVAARVAGHATTLLGKPLPLRFREVRDAGGMVYYLATLRVTRPDTLRFALRVTPVGAAPIEVDFSRDFP